MGILTALGHRVTHVRRSPHIGKSDEELVEVAKDFDVFITIDLFRGESEWTAVHRAMMEGDIKVVRLRLPKRKDEPRDILLDQARFLLFRMDQWMKELESGKCFITISGSDAQIRARTPDEVRAMLEQRMLGGADG